MADLSTRLTTGPRTVTRKPVAGAREAAASATPLAPSASLTIGAEARSLADKGVAFVKDHPGETAAGVATVAVAGVALANRDKFEQAGKNVVQALVDHPGTTAAAAGVLSYEWAKNGESLQNPLKPGGLKQDVRALKTYAGEHPMKAAAIATVAGWLGAKAAKSLLNLGKPQPGGYRVGDRIGNAVVVDPQQALNDTSGAVYKVLAIDFNNNGHIDPGEFDQLVVKLPPDAASDNSDVKDAKMARGLGAAIGGGLAWPIGSIAAKRELLELKLVPGSYDVFGLPFLRSDEATLSKFKPWILAGGAIAATIGALASAALSKPDVRSAQEAAEFKQVPNWVPPKAN